MIKTLIAAAVASLFAGSLAAQASAANDNPVIAQAGGGGSGSGGADGPDMANRQPGSMSSQPGAMSSDKASATGASSGDRFDRLDRNHDGYISRDEAKDASELDTRFSELDRDNDDKLSREEYNALGSGARGASGATGTGATSSMGSAPRPGTNPQPGKGGGDSSTSGANTK